MADKLGRNYYLSIQTAPEHASATRVAGDSVLVIRPPTTLEFDISRNFLGGGANNANFRIYNLSESHRNALRFDCDDFGTYQQVKMFAGYEDNLYLVFQGNIRRGSSIREGVNFITTLECLDGGFAYNNGFFSQTIPKNTAAEDQFKTIISKAMPHVTIGAIGSFPKPNLTAAPYSDYAVNLLKEAARDKFFIDNEKANVLNKNEYIDGPATLITPQTGLLQTPQLEEFNLHFDMVFEPRLNIGYLVKIQSTSDKKFNKLWRVNSIKHRGMISESVCGQVVTSISINYGSIALTAVRSQS